MHQKTVLPDVVQKITRPVRAGTAAAHHQSAVAVLLPIALGLRAVPAVACGASCPVLAAVLFGSGGGGYRRSLRPCVLQRSGIKGVAVSFARHSFKSSDTLIEYGIEG